MAAKIVLRVIWGVIAVVALAYAGDYAWAKVRMSGKDSGAALGSVMVQREYDVARKDGRVEFEWDPPEKETCVRSVFSHFGYAPCWWMERHKKIVVQ